MKITTEHIAETTLIVWAFTKSPVLAFFLMMYIIYINEDAKKAKGAKTTDNTSIILTPDELKARENEEHMKALTEHELKDPFIVGEATHFEVIDKFIVESYNDKFYRVMCPNGKYLEKIFLSKKDADDEVEMAKSVWPEEKQKESKVYDVRYIK